MAHPPGSPPAQAPRGDGVLSVALSLMAQLLPITCALRVCCVHMCACVWTCVRLWVWMWPHVCSHVLW